ncbi:Scaffold-type E3 ligase [Xylographa trunciseda]|nr:Scaffold-type E3 ligase [Xylographa trunciseda]
MDKEEYMDLEEVASYTAVSRPKRKLCRPPLIEYGLMGNDWRGQSIKLIPEADDDGGNKRRAPGMRNEPCNLRFHWDGLIKDYKDLSLSDEDRERILNSQLRPMFQLWVENAQDPIHWMTIENLPMLFRFALRRPLMPQQALIKRLDEIGVTDYLPDPEQSVEDVVQKRHFPVIQERGCHVSTEYKHRISKGNALNGPQVTWLNDNSAMISSVSKKAKHQVRFVLSSLSEEEQELIEDVANVIGLRRSGCYTSEQTMDVLYENFISYDNDFLKFLPEIESGSTSPQSLAERIYEDTQEVPCLVDDNDDETEDDEDEEDDERKIIKEISKAIGLCRSGRCTPDQTVDVLYDLFIGNDHDYIKYLPEITSGRVSPQSLAKRICEDTWKEATHGVDEVGDDKVMQSKQIASNAGHQKVSAKYEDKKQKVKIKFKFDTKGRFQDIYQQVLTGGLLPHEALPMFRSAVEKIDISDMGLANLMVEHDVPFDLFFGGDHSREDKHASKESEVDNGLEPHTSTIRDPLTPQDSRRTSKLLNLDPNASSVARFPEPDTPPEDSCPEGDNESGATLPSEISGDDKTGLLMQALQKLVDPEPYDCLCIDGSSEEAEVPSTFFEEKIETRNEFDECKECSTVHLPIAATTPEAIKKAEISKFGISITKDCSPGLADPVGQTSFLSRAFFAMRPVKYLSEVRMPYLQPGCSIRARIRHEYDIGRACDDSNPDLREHNRSDWEGCPQSAPGGPPDDYADICEHSSSPEGGETTALWGLAMPTSKARELGEKLGLRSDYVSENFRSSTPNRDAARKMSKLEGWRSIPYLKRKRYSPSPDHKSHKSRKGDEGFLFAEDGDDHRSFLEKRLRAPTPMVQVRSQSRCTVCNLSICNCRQLELCQSEMSSENALPSIEPSDSCEEAGVQSISENTEFRKKCHALSTYTPPIENPREGDPLDSDNEMPQLSRCPSIPPGQTFPPPQAHVGGQIGCSHTADKKDPVSAKLNEVFDSSTIKTQPTPDLVKEFIKWRIQWKQKGSDRNDVVSQGEEGGPKEPALPLQDDRTVVLNCETPKLSLLASTSSLGSMLSSEQHGTTFRPPAGKPPVPLFDKAVNDWVVKGPTGNTTVDHISESRSASRSARNVSISTAFLPLTIGRTSDTNNEPAQTSQDLPGMTPQHTSQPAIVPRKCSVVTTMKSLTIDDVEVSVPASSHAQPEASGQIDTDPVDSTTEHIEDSSSAILSSGRCSSSLPVSQDKISRPALSARDRSMHTIAEVVKANREELPDSILSPLQPTSTPSKSVVSMVEHIEAPSVSNVPSRTGIPLSPILQEVVPPLPICPSSPRPAAARLSPVSQGVGPAIPICPSSSRPAAARLAPQAPPIPLRDQNSMESSNAFQSSGPNSDIISRTDKLEQLVCKPPCIGASASLKRNRTESNSSSIRPSARLRVSSPVGSSTLHQDKFDTMNVEENHPTLDPPPPLYGSAPSGHPTNISHGHRHTSRKSRLLAKMDRYLARVARLPQLNVQQKPPWTQDNVEAAAWRFGASPRVYLWSKRQDREKRNQHIANRRCDTRYFQNPSTSAGKPSTASSLNKLFDKYRGMSLLVTPSHHALPSPISQFPDDPESPDTIGTAGTIKYLTDLSLSLDEPAVLAILTELSAPTMGELTRDGFLAGWRTLGADSIPKQIAALPHLRAQLSSNPDYFRRVYKHTFLLARTPGQKGVALDTAVEFWRLLFGSGGGVEWRGRDGTDWLGLWCGFVEERWRKTVSKDMWDQTGVFALKSLEDGSMAWWSEDGAWPGVLDEFVLFVRERRGDGGGGEGMDVE